MSAVCPAPLAGACRNVSFEPPRYRRLRPGRALADVVEDVWLQASPPTPGAVPTRVLPGGRVDLVLNYADPFVSLTGDAPQVMPRAHVVGQRFRPLLLGATGQTDLLVLRFTPWGAAGVFGGDLKAMAGQVVNLEDIWSHARVETLLAAAGNDRWRILERTLLYGWHADGQDGLVRESICRMSTGAKRIDQLAGDLGLGRRQFHRRFLRAVGVAPKPYLNLLRARRAVGQLRGGANVQDVVASCGFVDQSHLGHQVVAHSGLCPRQLPAEPETGLQQYFNNRESGDLVYL